MSAANTNAFTKAASRAVVRSPAKRAGRAASPVDAPRAPWEPGSTASDRLARERWAAEQLKQLLEQMEVLPIDEAARRRLERVVYFRGPEHVTLLIRTITESEGNGSAALVEPIVSAVSWAMSGRPDWPAKGLAWIEAFDGIPLVGTLETMRSLEAFEERELAQHLQTSLNNKLRRLLDPPPVPPKPKRAYKKRSPKGAYFGAHRLAVRQGCVLPEQGGSG
ncbi:hypothetical protein CK489_29090 [Bradyrhizobium sp. UFLA03-84]|uniref:hypothetical protein n=1 Tax=Bradyrhizobium sp. UFLA03-84 TaxID=418599 RepID=UPI000BAE411C|nr:hypothetical protein [Bradyrhizobium sp. UFLA03-84]PAY05441.1 hypothetical protein CK489_29090 [Bradyrhizobium sp. UFLA03-84]